MPNYRVTVKQVTTKIFEKCFEAETEDEAYDAASAELFDDGWQEDIDHAFVRTEIDDVCEE